MTMHQVYENSNDHPLEILFMMPYSENFSLNKIYVDYLLSDGTKKTLETIVSEREKAIIQYNEAVATGQTAIISYT